MSIFNALIDILHFYSSRFSPCCLKSTQHLFSLIHRFTFLTVLLLGVSKPLKSWNTKKKCCLFLVVQNLGSRNSAFSFFLFCMIFLKSEFSTMKTWFRLLFTLPQIYLHQSSSINIFTIQLFEVLLRTISHCLCSFWLPERV